MNKAIKLLHEEHSYIKELLEKTSKLFQSRETKEEVKESLLKCVSFFREYADNYHHNKEEKVLFPEMVKRNEMLQFGVIHEMLENHEDFRIALAEVEDFIMENNFESAEKRFNSYADSLLEHIAVEEEEVFQIAETLFSEVELQNIYYLFKDCDRVLGEEEKDSLEKIATFKK